MQLCQELLHRATLLAPSRITSCYIELVVFSPVGLLFSNSCESFFFTSGTDRTRNIGVWIEHSVGKWHQQYPQILADLGQRKKTASFYFLLKPGVVWHGGILRTCAFFVHETSRRVRRVEEHVAYRVQRFALLSALRRQQSWLDGKQKTRLDSRARNHGCRNVTTGLR